MHDNLWKDKYDVYLQLLHICICGSVVTVFLFIYIIFKHFYWKVNLAEIIRTLEQELTLKLVQFQFWCVTKTPSEKRWGNHMSGVFMVALVRSFCHKITDLSGCTYRSSYLPSPSQTTGFFLTPVSSPPKRKTAMSSIVKVLLLLAVMACISEAQRKFLKNWFVIIDN